jgi:hypothetical protein
MNHAYQRRTHTLAPRTVAGLIVFGIVATVAFRECEPLPVGAQETPGSQGEGATQIAPGKSAGAVDGGEPMATSPTAMARSAPDHDEAQIVVGGEVSQLALACFTEATGSEADCAAVNGVVTRRAKRAGMTWLAMLHAYSAMDRCKRVPTDAEWKRHVDIAMRVLNGEIANSCRGADHWGGLAIKRDHERAMRAVRDRRWVRVKCTARVRNAYFREVAH